MFKYVNKVRVIYDNQFEGNGKVGLCLSNSTFAIYRPHTDPLVLGPCGQKSLWGVLMV